MAGLHVVLAAGCGDLEVALEEDLEGWSARAHEGELGLEDGPYPAVVCEPGDVVGVYAGVSRRRVSSRQC